MPLILVPPYIKSFVGLLFGPTITSPLIAGYYEGLTVTQGGKSTMHRIRVIVRVNKDTGKITSEVHRYTTSSEWISSIAMAVFRNSISLGTDVGRQVSSDAYATVTADALPGNYKIAVTNSQPIDLTFTLAADGSVSNVHCIRRAYSTYGGGTNYGASDLSSQVVVS